MDTYRVETEPLWSWQGGICRPRNLAYRIPDGLDDAEREFVTLYIWPDMAFTRFAGSGSVATFVFEALGPEETRQVFTVYTPSGELDPVSSDIYRYFCDVLGPEDVGLVESVQQGHDFHGGAGGLFNYGNRLIHDLVGATTDSGHANVDAAQVHVETGILRLAHVLRS